MLTSQSNPSSITEKFLSAIAKQDYDAAKTFGTDDTARLLNMMSGFKKMSADSTGKDLKFEITSEKIEGENAIIYYKEVGKEGELQLPIVKVDGKWKVLLSKESINNSEGVNSLDGGATNTDTIK